MTQEQKRKRATDQQAHELTETDFASKKMGRNTLQGDDQRNVHNQRHAVPGVKDEADSGVMETLEKSDKNVRAERDLGKGERSGGSPKTSSKA